MEALKLKTSLAHGLAALLLPLALSACFGSRLDRGESPFGPAENPATQAPARLTGELPSADGGRVQLESEPEKPLLLVYSQETCVVCIGEAGKIRDSLPGGREPNNARILTVLVGADREIADEWKSSLELPWTVAYDENSELFKSHCPERQTPCTLIQLPGRGVVLRKTGEIGLDEIREFIGSWE